MSQNTKWRKQTLTLQTDSNFAQSTINIPPGKRVFAAAATSRTVNQIINLGLDENGSEIEPEMDLSFWKKTNSVKFLDGFKPLDYKGGSTLTIKATATTNLTEPLQIQVVFAILENNSSCN
ncbi:hypothetical protein [Zunongwangia sp.]|uniref:hypothetical protein n=1 Tax=Zunongwangia sp. TaxID=1965325 RepID=UPI003AA8F997